MSNAALVLAASAFLVCANIGLVVGNLWIAREQRCRLKHIREIDDLLTAIAVNSLTQWRMPVWLAWSQSMGGLGFTVDVERREP